MEQQVLKPKDLVPMLGTRAERGFAGVAAVRALEAGGKPLLLDALLAPVRQRTFAVRAGARHRDAHCHAPRDGTVTVG